MKKKNRKMRVDQEITKEEALVCLKKAMEILKTSEVKLVKSINLEFRGKILKLSIE